MCDDEFEWIQYAFDLTEEQRRQQQLQFQQQQQQQQQQQLQFQQQHQQLRQQQHQHQHQQHQHLLLQNPSAANVDLLHQSNVQLQSPALLEDHVDHTDTRRLGQPSLLSLHEQLNVGVIATSGLEHRTTEALPARGGVPGMAWPNVHASSGEKALVEWTAAHDKESPGGATATATAAATAAEEWVPTTAIARIAPLPSVEDPVTAAFSPIGLSSSSSSSSSSFHLPSAAASPTPAGPSKKRKRPSGSSSSSTNRAPKKKAAAKATTAKTKKQASSATAAAASAATVAPSPAVPAGAGGGEPLAGARHPAVNPKYISVEKEAAALAAVEALRNGKRRRRMKSQGPFQEGRWKNEEIVALLTVASTFIKKELRAVCDICVFANIRRPSRAIDKQLKRMVKYERWSTRDQASVLASIQKLLASGQFGQLSEEAAHCIAAAEAIWGTDGPEEDADANPEPRAAGFAAASGAPTVPHATAQAATVSSWSSFPNES